MGMRCTVDSPCLTHHARLVFTLSYLEIKTSSIRLKHMLIDLLYLQLIEIRR